MSLVPLALALPVSKLPPDPPSASLGRPLPEGRGGAQRWRLPLLPSGEKVAAERPDEGAKPKRERPPSRDGDNLTKSEPTP